ncbi:conserved hypothetical protein [Cupriavidus taiwanensis]|uniref:acetyltransferase n=1 Tax=Cupriavidus taiwanensis TaxID=164546 RepID=UPI000E171F68|nr:acetyltransferase [Cupriavidus taiwanensis]SPA26387.1 conserved hypothetical protein [Cupriavidus taiwanensis]
MSAGLTPLVIYGAGGFAREVLQVALDMNSQTPRWDVQGFLVDPGYDVAEPVHGLPVMTTDTWLAPVDGELVIAIGDTSARRAIADRMHAQFGMRFATLVHPRAWVGRQVRIGEGSVICAGALITTDISIGRHVHVNLGCTIGHDAILEDFVTLNPSVNVSGNVHLCEGVMAGTGVKLIPHIRVGAGTVLGAGAVAVADLPADVTAVGIPAKAIRQHDISWSIQSLEGQV